ncbi:DUF4177 domain-containing protein [Haliangium sp.]|uniref:DUF4177 domain-containing protein n=1 Tax=Haliangium sp. TaxID=2663208 RepID=UPI003D099DA1
MQWQYRVVKLAVGRCLSPGSSVDPVQQVLDEMGSEGWELVSVSDTALTQRVSDELLLFFKRPGER